MKCLDQISKKSSFSITEESLRLLSREAGGSLRDALSLLDQVMAYSENGISDQEVLESLGTIDRTVLFDLVGSLITGDVVSALSSLDALFNQGYDLKRLYAQMLEHFRHLLVVKIDKTEKPLVDAPAHVVFVLEVLIALGPLAVYFLGLGLVNSQPRPCLVNARADGPDLSFSATSMGFIRTCT